MKFTNFTPSGLPIVDREELNQLILESSTNKRGLLVLGVPGVGKTYAVRKPRMVSASMLAMEFQLNGIDGVRANINNQIQYQGGTVVIDDLGIEENVKHYGNGIDPIAWVIQSIYDINQTSDLPIMILLTSNLNMEELTKRYGIRVIERIQEMCTTVALQDTNIRKQLIDNPVAIQTTSIESKTTKRCDTHLELLEGLED